MRQGAPVHVRSAPWPPGRRVDPFLPVAVDPPVDTCLRQRAGRLDVAAEAIDRPRERSQGSGKRARATHLEAKDDSGSNPQAAGNRRVKSPAAGGQSVEVRADRVLLPCAGFRLPDALRRRLYRNCRSGTIGRSTDDEQSVFGRPCGTIRGARCEARLVRVWTDGVVAMTDLELPHASGVMSPRGAAVRWAASGRSQRGHHRGSRRHSRRASCCC